MSKRTYKINVEARILELLGPSLYTNIYYVLGELIANAYDADAKNVYIISSEHELIVEDDGHGMSYKEGGVDKYLKVAAENTMDSTTVEGRRKMGRKGIGKLAALAVSDKVLIKTQTSEGEKSGFILERTIPDNGNLQSLEESDIYFNKNTKVQGTSIIMQKPEYELHKTKLAVKKRILSLFPAINEDFKIHVFLPNCEKFIIDDFEKEKMKELNGLITIGEEFSKLHEYLELEFEGPQFINKRDSAMMIILDEHQTIDENIKIDQKGKYKDYYGKKLEIKGWLGVYKSIRGKEKQITDFPDIAVSIYSNNKLGIHNILPELTKNRVNESYIVAHFHIDLFEDEELPDMALSNRQGYKTDDIRYILALKMINRVLEDGLKIRMNVARENAIIKNKTKNEIKIKEKSQLQNKVDSYRENVVESIGKLKSDDQGRISETEIEKIVSEELTNIIELKQKVDEGFPKILISHTERDKKFADIIYEMLIFNNIPRKEIIYSSSEHVDSKIPYDGTNISDIYDYLREFFVEIYSKQKIFIIFITTENTSDSWGTLVELGATWIVRSQHIIFNLNDYKPKEPLSLQQILNIYMDNEQEFFVEKEEGLKLFFAHLKQVCDNLGYTMKNEKSNIKRIREASDNKSEGRRIMTTNNLRKFRKKPVVIQAYQTDCIEYIETLEGTMKAEIGDWIVIGIQGERYPVKPDIFAATYEELD